MGKSHTQAYESFKLLEEQKYETRATHIFDCEPSLAVFLLLIASTQDSLKGSIF
ncbi:hypothetical protein ACLI07_00580 [Providencia huaxiensis]|uniref:hypothetical protein n=1 Tax=Providencia TaxID=586 RepID=UPI00143E0302|nr:MULTISPECIES: hypothetical protein [Providencia]MBN6363357.1 hypothetical protein [Providencia huaxiensis]MBZ3680838.1 hypothetical protein [Providencia rettgeri]